MLVKDIAGLYIPPHDCVELVNNSAGDPTSITYKSGGSSGTTVAVLTLTYTNNFLTKIEKA